MMALASYSSAEKQDVDTSYVFLQTAFSQHYSFDREPGSICRDLASDLCDAMRTVSLAILCGLHIQLPPSTTCKAVPILQVFNRIYRQRCLKTIGITGDSIGVCIVHCMWGLGSVSTNDRLIDS